MITGTRTVDKEFSFHWEQWKDYHLIRGIWSHSKKEKVVQNLPRCFFVEKRNRSFWSYSHYEVVVFQREYAEGEPEAEGSKDMLTSENLL